METARPARIAAPRQRWPLGARTAAADRLDARSLCLVAGGRFDAMLSLRAIRSVDAAAGQLIVREAGGAVAFPDIEGGDLRAPDLDMRSARRRR